MSFAKKLDQVLLRHNELSQQLSQGIDDPKQYIKISKEYAELNELTSAIKELNKIEQDIKENNQLLDDPESDNEIKEMVADDLENLKQAKKDKEKQIQIMLLPKDKDDNRNAIVEIRAGTGGDEAALFAADLLRMYQRFADIMKWKTELISANDTGIGGLKEASLSIAGTGVFSKLKFESGVHRVQRVPETESSGRIHTSAATVAVLPEVEDVDVTINEKDIRIDVFRASGPGGQSVNTTDSAVRITHIPTGIVVSQQDEKSQHKNKAKAMKVMRSRIYDFEKQKKLDERAENRKSQIGSGDRSERIRTYNFPQGRVTDHRINLTLYKLEQILSGELLEIINPIIAEDQAEKLAELS